MIRHLSLTTIHPLLSRLSYLPSIFSSFHSLPIFSLSNQTKHSEKSNNKYTDSSPTHRRAADHIAKHNTMPRSMFACFRRSRGGTSSMNEALPPSHESATADQTVEEQRRGGAVVVELFSSQGCATSPEAELLMSRLGRGDFKLEMPVVVLAYHVDYWDYNGWKDPFGSSQWTVRQKAYVEAFKLDTMFTPQVVVQGGAQCIGTDEDALLSSIASVPRYPALSLQANFTRPTTDSLQVSFTGPLRTKVDSNGVNVMVALYENGQVTDCQKGANKDRVLANDFVVRRLEKLCFVKDMSAKKPVSGTIHFTLWETFNSSKCGVAVFLQSASHQIFGSQNFGLPDL